ncbi:unnamed protein product [Didymodactylos carnosus]|uniref:Uncharacterized protein n=2 Tax=Didymodactylos carnosus TaxID=1234261 RepID=A0A815Z7M5_9BILA|nr:unnamed protein product [Didymodactylos carnosus]CAF4446490.1 unnamed protein product [Didymodactylos carnosus]
MDCVASIAVGSCRYIRPLRVDIELMNNTVKNEQIKQACSSSYYVAPSEFQVYHIDKETSETTIDYLIETAHQTNAVTVDTESDHYTDEPAFVQVQLIRINGPSPIILFECAHLPPSTSSLFKQIQRLSLAIFNSGRTVYSWGELRKEFEPFQCFQLFRLPYDTKLVNIQGGFKTWYNKFNFVEQNLTLEDDEPDVLIVNVPKYEVNSFVHSIDTSAYRDPNNAWSLQKAIAVTFGTFLDKRLTLSRWACGLDPKLQTWMTSELTGQGEWNKQQVENYEATFEQLIRRSTVTEPTTIKSVDVLVDHVPDDLLVSTDVLAAQVLNDRSISTKTTTTRTWKHKTPHRTERDRKRRSHKTSIRMRRKRYTYEVIRDIFERFSISNVKSVLRSLRIKWVNVHLVRHRMFLGLKDDTTRIQCEQRLTEEFFTENHYRALYRVS